ncbi:unannotated protein [freshwater metagenome]|uniref:Unannotated protein n=1 Tax=freshwater metagenome TaxID=449393 RepID=A0A6J7C6K2_9ZZZZ
MCVRLRAATSTAPAPASNVISAIAIAPGVLVPVAGITGLNGVALTLWLAWLLPTALCALILIA